MIRRTIFAALALAGLYSTTAMAAEELVVYSSRKEELLKPLFEKFTQDTGIEVKFLFDEAPKLIARLESEGAATPADMLITADVGNLESAKAKGLFAALTSGTLEKNVPEKYRDKDRTWYALSKRVRAVFYNRDKVKPEELSTYEALADAKWKGEILARSSSHPYNQSLIANYIAVHGAEAGQQWVNGITANLARPPQGGDADQIKAVAAGEAKLAIGNSYYYGRMLTSDLPEDALVRDKVVMFYPNQRAAKGELDGVHVNVSGGGVIAASKHAAEAQRLLEYLSSAPAQRMYADSNKEFPINAEVPPHQVLQTFGSFREDSTPLTAWARLGRDATIAADKSGWK